MLIETAESENYAKRKIRSWLTAGLFIDWWHEMQLDGCSAVSVFRIQDATYVSVRKVVFVW